MLVTVGCSGCSGAVREWMYTRSEKTAREPDTWLLNVVGVPHADADTNFRARKLSDLRLTTTDCVGVGNGASRVQPSGTWSCSSVPPGGAASRVAVSRYTASVCNTRVPDLTRPYNSDGALHAVALTNSPAASSVTVRSLR